MKKILIFSMLLLGCISFLAFSPINRTSEYHDISSNEIQTEMVSEVGSFTEMYTRSVLSDKSTWSHRYKEYTLTAANYNIYSLETSLNRN